MSLSLNKVYVNKNANKLLKWGASPLELDIWPVDPPHTLTVSEPWLNLQSSQLKFSVLSSDTGQRTDEDWLLCLSLQIIAYMNGYKVIGHISL